MEQYKDKSFHCTGDIDQRTHLHLGVIILEIRMITNYFA